MAKENPLPASETHAQLPQPDSDRTTKETVVPVSYASKILKRDRRTSDKIQPIINQVATAENIKPILFQLTQDIQKAFNCEKATLYALDRAKRQIYSRNFQGEDIKEIRLDIAPKSLAGYVASTGKSLNINNVYDKKELAKHQPPVVFDGGWDKKTKFKTRSVLALPLPHNKKLMGVLEIINKQGAGYFTQEDLRLSKEIASTLGLAIVKMDVEDFQEKLLETSHAIHSAQSIDEILLKLRLPILQLFDASLVTIYAVDVSRNEIYSKIKSGDTVSEIRVPISPKSIAGWVAMEKKILNIADVYDREELKKHGNNLNFDDTWDKKSGVSTKSMLVVPLLHENRLMGVLQLVNKKSTDTFTPFDEKNAQIICSTLALAFFNQKKLAQAKSSKFSYLLVHGIITEEELTAATAKSRKQNIDIENVLLQDLSLRREDVGKSLEHFYKMPYFGHSDSFVLPGSLFSGLNKDFLVKNHWVPLQDDENKVMILINDPDNDESIQKIKLNFPKKKIEFKIGLKVDILDYLNAAVGESEEARPDKTEELSSILEELLDEKAERGLVSADQEDEVSMFSEKNSGIVRLVNKVITDAYKQGVSDIHIEPGVGKKNMRVRFRKDGECHLYQEIPFHYKQALISRIKIMSRLNIAEKRLPQDGKIKMKYGKSELELRVATCPTVGGNEDVVMRILASSKPIPLDKMNFSKRNLKLVKDKITKPYGLILVVGPTGSGKTTTLHSVLGHINTPGRKIWTAEDPVEITQEGLRQVQMQNKIGLDFARAMRSFLRGDPDVIMVGEMRDAETCAIGLEASLTGHLVLSTLHTNSAPETITRLIDMGMNPINFADALLLIVAQRLVRTLCKFCKQPYQPNRGEFDNMVQEYGGEEQFAALGIQFSDYLTLYRAVGCSQCNHTGYSGRTGLHELLEGTDDIKRLIMQKSMMEDIRQQAMKAGMTTLKQDGLAKVFTGDCDLKQVLAVCIV